MDTTNWETKDTRVQAIHRGIGAGVGLEGRESGESWPKVGMIPPSLRIFAIFEFVAIVEIYLVFFEIDVVRLPHLPESLEFLKLLQFLKFT